MTHLFIADLHLSPDHPRLVRGFLDLLTHYQDQNTQLYILGDWFNAWIGDDYSSAWLDDIVKALKVFTQANNQVYFQVGNRDFVLGKQFLQKFDGQLLPDSYTLNIGKTTFHLEHGDALCTDDVSYQKFRKIIRNPLLLGFLKRLPLSFRQKLAHGFRQKSASTQQEKSYAIMDVNQTAVQHAIQDVDVMIHGHTHRPQIHHEFGKVRIVLGDWRQDQAKILALDDSAPINDLQLKIWKY